MEQDEIAKLYLQANELKNQGNDKEALAVLRKIIQDSPHFVQAQHQADEIMLNNERRHMQHATLFETKGDYEEAIREYVELLEVNPLIWKAHKNLALLYQKAGKMNKAIIEIRKAIALAPDLCGLRLTLAKFCEIQSNYENALQEYLKAAELNPSDVFIQRQLEISKKIYAFFSQDPRPEDPFAYVDIGNLFMEKEMPEKSVELFTEAYNRAKRSQEIIYALGRAYYQMKNFTEAIKYFNAALAIAPATVSLDEIQYLLGLSHSGLNNYKQAIDALRSCINVNPNGKCAARAQATIPVLQNYIRGMSEPLR